MRNDQLEAWVLDLADTVQAGRVPEDSRVEFKAEWPADARKAARRLGGHANASRGDPVLWVVGIDEKRGITGASRADLATWYQQVSACFDGVAPELVKDLDVPIGDKRAVALLFDTSRPPYVVKNEQGGEIAREVPWRQGTRVNSATRGQLLRVLSPLQASPVVEPMWATANASASQQPSRVADVIWNIHLGLYLVPRGPDRLIIPLQHAGLTVGFDGSTFSPTAVELSPHRSRTYTYDAQSDDPIIQFTADHHTVLRSDSEIIFAGPGMIEAEAHAFTGKAMRPRDDSSVLLVLRLKAIGIEEPVVVNFELRPKPSTPTMWEFVSVP